MATQPQTILLRKPSVLAAIGISTSQLYRRIQAGLVTRPVRTGPNSSAWPQHEIEAITRAIIAGKPDDQIRALVTALHAARAEGV